MPPMELMPVEEQPTFDVSDSGFNNPLYGTVGKVIYNFTLSFSDLITSTSRALGIHLRNQGHDMW